MDRAKFERFALVTLDAARRYAAQHPDEYRRWKEAKQDDNGQIQSQQAPAPHE